MMLLKIGVSRSEQAGTATYIEQQSIQHWGLRMIHSRNVPEVYCRYTSEVGKGETANEVG